MKSLATLLSLIAANFIWQWMIGDMHWSVAFERSYFQVMAVAAVKWLS
jgi:hypothetical protein